MERTETRLDILSLHSNEYGTEPEVVASAPGILHLMGAHTEHSDGLALSLATNRRVAVAVSVRKDTSLRFYSASFDERKRTTIANLKYKREDRWANYVKGVILEFYRLGCPVRGLNVTIAGDVPFGIGLGSSEAVGVATATALRSLFRYSMQDLQMLQRVKNSEVSFLGKDTGIVPFIASYFAQSEHALFMDLRSMRHSFVPFSFPEVSVLVINPNIPYTMEPVELKKRREECNRCVEILGEGRNGVTLRDFSQDDLNETLGTLPETLRRHCLHIVGEITRVRETEKLLRNRDLHGVGKMMLRSHASLRDLYEISFPEIDWLVKRSVETEGVYGAKLAGNGGGFSAVTVLKSSALNGYYSRLEEYERIFGFKADSFLTESSDGARVESD
jgi:galactokinase